MNFKRKNPVLLLILAAFLLLMLLPVNLIQKNAGLNDPITDHNYFTKRLFILIGSFYH